jgi:hypothetical protein
VLGPAGGASQLYDEYDDGLDACMAEGTLTLELQSDPKRLVTTDDDADTLVQSTSDGSNSSNCSSSAVAAQGRLGVLRLTLWQVSKCTYLNVGMLTLEDCVHVVAQTCASSS